MAAFGGLGCSKVLVGKQDHNLASYTCHNNKVDRGILDFLNL